MKFVCLILGAKFVARFLINVHIPIKSMPLCYFTQYSSPSSGHTITCHLTQVLSTCQNILATTTSYECADVRWKTKVNTLSRLKTRMVLRKRGPSLMKNLLFGPKLANIFHNLTTIRDNCPNRHMFGI